MNLRSVFSLFSSDLAIDLGTSNTLVFAKAKVSWSKEGQRVRVLSLASEDGLDFPMERVGGEALV